MKKTLMLCVGIVVFLLFSSAFKGSGIAPSVGSFAPAFEIEKVDSTISLDDLRGKYVVLSFWAAADARSRLRCNELTATVDDINDNCDKAENKVCLVAVNFDRSQKLFQEIVRRDRLDGDTQFYVEGNVADQLRHDYDLDKGYKSFLIAPSGKIIAINPTSDYLTQNLSL